MVLLWSSSSEQMLAYSLLHDTRFGMYLCSTIDRIAQPEYRVNETASVLCDSQCQTRENIARHISATLPNTSHAERKPLGINCEIDKFRSRGGAKRYRARPSTQRSSTVQPQPTFTRISRLCKRREGGIHMAGTNRGVRLDVQLSTGMHTGKPGRAISITVFTLSSANC